MLPKLRAGKWPTLFFRGMESCRHHFLRNGDLPTLFSGWKVDTKPIETKGCMPELKLKL